MRIHLYTRSRSIPSIPLQPATLVRGVCTLCVPLFCNLYFYHRKTQQQRSTNDTDLLGKSWPQISVCCRNMNKFSGRATESGAVLWSHVAWTRDHLLDPRQLSTDRQIKSLHQRGLCMDVASSLRRKANVQHHQYEVRGFGSEWYFHIAPC